VNVNDPLAAGSLLEDHRLDVPARDILSTEAPGGLRDREHPGTLPAASIEVDIEDYTWEKRA